MTYEQLEKIYLSSAVAASLSEGKCFVCKKTNKHLDFCVQSEGNRTASSMTCQDCTPFNTTPIRLKTSMQDIICFKLINHL